MNHIIFFSLLLLYYAQTVNINGDCMCNYLYSLEVFVYISIAAILSFLSNFLKNYIFINPIDWNF